MSLSDTLDRLSLQTSKSTSISTLQTSWHDELEILNPPRNALPSTKWVKRKTPAEIAMAHVDDMKETGVRYYHEHFHLPSVDVEDDDSRRERLFTCDGHNISRLAPEYNPSSSQSRSFSLLDPPSPRSLLKLSYLPDETSTSTILETSTLKNATSQGKNIPLFQASAKKRPNKSHHHNQASRKFVLSGTTGRVLPILRDADGVYNNMKVSSEWKVTAKEVLDARNLMLRLNERNDNRRLKSKNKSQTRISLQEEIDEMMTVYETMSSHASSNRSVDSSNYDFDDVSSINSSLNSFDTSNSVHVQAGKAISKHFKLISTSSSSSSSIKKKLYNKNSKIGRSYKRFVKEGLRRGDGAYEGDGNTHAISELETILRRTKEFEDFKRKELEIDEIEGVRGRRREVEQRRVLDEVLRKIQVLKEKDEKWKVKHGFSEEVESKNDYAIDSDSDDSDSISISRLEEENIMSHENELLSTTNSIISEVIMDFLWINLEAKISEINEQSYLECVNRVQSVFRGYVCRKREDISLIIGRMERRRESRRRLNEAQRRRERGRKGGC